MGVDDVRAPDHETFTVVKFADAVTDDGGMGSPTAASERVITFEGTLEPTALRAVTRKLFVTPGVKASIRTERLKFDRVATTTHVAPASVERHTSYEVTAVPPLLTGDPQDKYADVPEIKPVIDVGADGTAKAIGVIVTTLDEGLLPIAFTANTRN
jgi:hypothetical protein